MFLSSDCAVHAAYDLLPHVQMNDDDEEDRETDFGATGFQELTTIAKAMGKVMFDIY